MDTKESVAVPPFKVGFYTVINPDLVLTTYTTWDGVRVPGTEKTQKLGLALLEMDANDRRTGCSPIAPHFGQIAQLQKGDQLPIQLPNGYVRHFEC